MSWLARNRAFLAEYDPELLAELVHAEIGELEIRQTRRGQSTLRFRSPPVHSQVDPIKEAQRVVGPECLHLPVTLVAVIGEHKAPRILRSTGIQP